MAVITINKTDKEDKKIFTINDFRGVDFSNSMVDVSPKRASYMLNMINDNGINRKRNGWVNKTKIVSIGNTLIDAFVIPLLHNLKVYMTIENDGEHDYNTIHFYNGNEENFSIGLDQYHDDTTVTAGSGKYQCYFNRKEDVPYGYTWFENVGYFYLFGNGNFIKISCSINLNQSPKLLQFSIIKNEAYIPTTSIGITSSGNVTSYEEINILTTTRKNELEVSGAGTYKLDATNITISLDSIKWFSSSLGSYISFYTEDGTIYSSPAKDVTIGIMF